MDHPPVLNDPSHVVLASRDDGSDPVSTASTAQALDRDGDAAVLADAVDAYRQILAKATHAQQFLAAVGLGDPALVQRFNLGFCDKSLIHLLPSKDRAARDQMTRLGVLRTTGHPQHLGCIVVPVYTDGTVVDAIGMRQHPLTRQQQGQAIESRWSEQVRGVWNAEALMGSTVILTPYVRDALACVAAGYTAATVAPDPDLHQDLRELLVRRDIREAILTHGAHEEGDLAARRIAIACAGLGISCRRISYKKADTLGHYAARNQPVRLVLDPLLAQARLVVLPPKVVVSVRPMPATAQVVANAVAASVVDVEPQVTQAVASSSPVAAAPTVVTGADVSTGSAVPPVQVVPSGDDLDVVVGPRRYQVRGLAKNRTREVLRITLRVADGAGHLHLDVIDLYHARQRAAFVQAAAEELAISAEVVKHDLGVLLREVERIQDHRLAVLAASGETEAGEAAPPALTPSEEEQALAFLRAPDLVARILADFTTCGVVGECANALIGYLAAVSRKLEQPLAVIVQSLSAAGKSTLLDAVLGFVPEEDRISYSSLTSKSLYYLPKGALRHKVLSIAEAEGAAQATYALKLLQSDRSLTVATPRTDARSGRLQTQAYRVDGPIALMLSTTAVEVDEELANRAIVLAVDEERGQTARIHEVQRRHQTLAGLREGRERERVQMLHRNAQRLIRPVFINNPWAERLRYRDDRTRSRRDHLKYLTLIRAVTLMHQHQRQIQWYEEGGEHLPYIDVTLSDIAVANALAHQVLGRSLDELPPHSRRLLEHLDALVTAGCQQESVSRSAFRFSRRDVRAGTGWTDHQVRSHLEKLIELEYVLIHRGTRGQSYEYELLYDGQGRDGQPFCLGLIDVASLAMETCQAVPVVAGLDQLTQKFAVSGGEFAGGSRVVRGRFADAADCVNGCGKSADAVASGESKAASAAQEGRHEGAQIVDHCLAVTYAIEGIVVPRTPGARTVESAPDARGVGLGRNALAWIGVGVGSHGIPWSVVVPPDGRAPPLGLAS